MIELIDIPLVKPVAEWIWGLEDAVTCLSEVPLLSAPCLSQLFAKALGVVIIIASCLNKIPIMKNMVSAQSAAGISRNSLYGEALVYANSALYGLLSGHPFTAYGENCSLLAQNAILVVLAWKFAAKQSPVKSQEKLLVAIFGVVYVGGILKFLPEEHRHLLMSSTWPVLLYARGSQVFETYLAKHTGSLSIVTTTMNLVGSIIRILTTIKETGDMVVISGYLLGGGLSLLMFLQYWLYLAKTTEISKAAEDSKKEKKE
uniref:Mannose-P-dolichol utilization defect 1 protein homolog n=1 Tax=Pseudo-nitzschia delicatissima TaxID=44447 RepID=A0A7S0UFM2_9STRA|mmetsp:Transcript_1700/g.3566  ORF Transcript_1700/g.3566 Transcript_1700/m.3566 type:complete len:259 (+) Transcript_1700:94-870(+)